MYPTDAIVKRLTLSKVHITGYGKERKRLIELKG